VIDVASSIDAPMPFDQINFIAAGPTSPGQNRAAFFTAANLRRSAYVNERSNLFARSQSSATFEFLMR